MAPNYEELITQLISAMSQRSLFHRDHPRVRGSVGDFVRGLRERLAADGHEVFFLGVAENRIVHDGRFLFGSTLLGRKLLQFADHLRCGGLLFKRELGEVDVLALLDLHVALRHPAASLAEARERLKQATEHIQLSPPYQDPGWFGQFVYGRSESAPPASESEVSPGAARVYQKLFESVDVAHEHAARDGEIDVNGARSLAEELLKNASKDLHDVLRLVRYPDYDSYTVGHSVRVALLAVQIGSTLGFGERQLIELGTAGLLHDVGKAKIPHEILFKPGKLDADERRVIAQHPKLGADLLIEQHDIGPLSVGAAFGHHLRHDRAGYPAIPQWHSVGRATAIVQVCDVFEALTAVRPYKPQLSPRRAFEIMSADHHAFHPAAFAALVRSMGLYPPGSRVQLSNGERGIVVAAGEDIERPRIQVTHDAQGHSTASSEARVRDLASQECAQVKVTRLLEDMARPAGSAAAATHVC